MNKVLYICNYKPGVGGISGQVEALQRHLREEGYVADVFSTKGSFFDRLRMPLRLQRSVQDYDVVHIHCCSGWGFLPVVLGVKVAKKKGKRVVLTYHGGGAETFFRKRTRIVRKYLLQTDANIVLSGFLGNIFDKYKIPYTTIPNIIELDESLYRERTTLKPDFICIRSHEGIYNIPCILRAFKRVQQVLLDATLTLVGDGSLHQNMIHMAEDMGLKKVIFTGRVDNSRIYEYLNKADIMLSSPTVDNMPVSLLEAMNAGLLVISSNVGGVPYMIEDEKTGLLFNSNDDKSLANLIIWALEHQNESLRIIKNEKTETVRYSWEGIRKRIISLYND